MYTKAKLTKVALQKLCDASTGCIGINFGKNIDSYLRFSSAAAVKAAKLPIGWAEKDARSHLCQSNCKITSFSKEDAECWVKESTIETTTTTTTTTTAAATTPVTTGE